MRMITFFLVGLTVHVVFFLSIFDIYFTSPLVHGMTPQATSLDPPASRLVLMVADGLRADSLFRCSQMVHLELHISGWKENPVEFDSVFNESRHTWSWGSPDILPMFAKGATGDHVYTHTYPAGEEDFASKDASGLDTWVFDQVKSFFETAKNNSSLKAALHENKNVFFLHLLGLDTNGHAHRPMSQEYLNNIGLVDTGISELVSMVEDFFGNDGRTAYVLTSDHGMTNWDSDPLVVWGAGVSGPVTVTEPPQIFNDEFLKDWNLEHYRRVDVNQADIAPLMASLIGVNFPVNSVGVLPLQYLNNSEKFKAESMYTNAIQVLEQYKVKMVQKKETTLSLLFTPYQYLTNSKQAELVNQIRIMFQLEKYEDAILLRLQRGAGFVGWTSYVVLVILKTHAGFNRNTKLINKIPSFYLSGLCGIVAVLIAIFLFIQRSPLTYYIYCLLPVPVWYSVLKEFGILVNLVHSVPSLPMWKCLSYFVLVAFGMNYCACAGLLALFTSSCFLWSSRQKTPLYHSETKLLLFQMIHVTLCAFIPSLTHSSLQQKQGLPLLSQIISWTTLGSSILIPLLSSTRLFHRLLSILLSLTATYLLLSTALFPPALSWVMFVWINIEQEALLGQGLLGRQELSTIDFTANIDITKIRQLKLDDIRRSYFFVFFIITAFFGTGNIASINSFDPASVYCFLTVFNPFIMGGLMMWKHFFFLVQDYGSWLDIGTSISHYVIVMSMTIFLMVLSVVTHILTSLRLVLWRKSKMHYP
ncbi:hypothetical protein WMY93_029718 [Mugilogobius chulae]|uniref:GPI ethanolamine phosphate transferase 1 n=1 Tax=Mugilogobius chulae TaxID=88201 RepID=A0AAW0MTH3_9GOBI